MACGKHCTRTRPASKQSTVPQDPSPTRTFEIENLLLRSILGPDICNGDACFATNGADIEMEQTGRSPNCYIAFIRTITRVYPDTEKASHILIIANRHAPFT